MFKEFDATCFSTESENLNYIIYKDILFYTEAVSDNNDVGKLYSVKLDNYYEKTYIEKCYEKFGSKGDFKRFE